PRLLAVIGQRRTREAPAPARYKIEAEHDRMRLADLALLHAELVAQADIEPVRHDHETRRDLLARRQGDALALGTCRDIHHLADDAVDAWRNLAAHRVDHRVVENAVLIARALLDQAAETRHPGLAVERCGTQHRLADAGLAQDRGLRAVDLLGAEIRR